MKLARILFALVLITAAGMAFAAQPSADTAEEPVAPDAEVTSPTQQEEIVPSQIDGLFVEPVEQDACCRANCLEEKTACQNACSGEPGCFDQCWDEYNDCVSFCF